MSSSSAFMIVATLNAGLHKHGKTIKQNEIIYKLHKLTKLTGTDTLQPQLVESCPVTHFILVNFIKLALSNECTCLSHLHYIY